MLTGNCSASIDDSFAGKGLTQIRPGEVIGKVAVNLNGFSKNF
ncbi:hypothetical protein BN440_1876 [Erwinia amylovora MR1]|nr:hypothetical protein BN440_1876 [Erwinia amylovora MR1]